MEYEELIEEIKKQCDRQNISLYKLSKMSGVPQSTIYGIMNDKNKAQIDTLCEILKALGLKIVICPKDEETQQSALREREYELTDLPDEEKEAVVRLIEWLKD